MVLTSAAVLGEGGGDKRGRMDGGAVRLATVKWLIVGI